MTLLTGSYAAEDCQFLLQAVDVPMLSVEEKEQQLQKGGRHYSEILSAESAPSKQYLQLFHRLMQQYKTPMAQQIANLAATVREFKGAKVTIVSLARAGTPVGVMLTRALRYYYPECEVRHYSISIVRDKGIDTEALHYLKKQNISPDSILFVDGWTAKGVITRELKAAVYHWNQENPDFTLQDQLCVISDIGGTADLVATREDYAIPSGILNSTVSGLISRSLLLPEISGFHQCAIYDHLAKEDLSNWFVDQISVLFRQLAPETIDLKPSNRAAQAKLMANYVARVMREHQVGDINKVKPGIAEATRVMLRRIPRLLIVKNKDSADVAHLLELALEKQVPVLEDATMPLNATALIANVV
ncbi:MAG: cysteine protease StiP family protein [Pseudomonadales bacterium]|nr:cysteine protease StiP family protein [Pseudomonadales bacterium]